MSLSNLCKCAKQWQLVLRRYTLLPSVDDSDSESVSESLLTNWQKSLESFQTLQPGFIILTYTYVASCFCTCAHFSLTTFSAAVSGYPAAFSRQWGTSSVSAVPQWWAPQALERRAPSGSNWPPRVGSRPESHNRQIWKISNKIREEENWKTAEWIKWILNQNSRMTGCQIRKFTYFKLSVEIPRDTPEANLTKNT